MKCEPVLACGFGAKNEQELLFPQFQFYRCTDLHATYKLASGGQSSLRSESLSGGSQLSMKAIMSTKSVVSLLC